MRSIPRLAIGLIIMLFLGGWALLASRKELPTLLERSRKIAPIDPGDVYRWRSPRTLEVESYGPTGNARVVQLNITDQSEQVVPPGLPYDRSPDGRFEVEPGSKANGYKQSIREHGSGRVVGVLPHAKSSIWLPDSSSLIQLTKMRNVLMVHPVRPLGKPYFVQPALPTMAPVRGFRGTNAPPRIEAPGGSYVTRWPAPDAVLLGVTKNNSAILTTWRDGQTVDIDLFDVKLSREDSGFSTHTIAISQGYRVDDVAVSPDGTQAAICLNTLTPMSFVEDWLDRAGLYKQRNRLERSELWICDLNGNNRRRLGWVPVVGGQGSLTSLKWRTDGKCLSFNHNRGIHQIEVE